MNLIRMRIIRYLKFGIGLITFLVIYFLLLPLVSDWIPSDYQKRLHNQNIDATPLFYTESEQALKSYYYLKLTGNP